MTLRLLSPDLAFETAIETIQIISAETEDKQMDDPRERVLSVKNDLRTVTRPARILY